LQGAVAALRKGPHPETGHLRPYTPGAAYGRYFASTQTMFPVWLRSSLLHDKARVFTLLIEGRPKA